MLTPEQRQQVEQEAARDIRRYYREVQPTTFAGIVDDIRHKLVEEGVYGRQVTGNISGEKVIDETALYGTARIEPSSHGTGRDIHGNPMEDAQPGAVQAPATRREPEAGL